MPFDVRNPKNAPPELPPDSLWDQIVEWFFNSIWFPLRDWWKNNGGGPPPTRPA
jgi:hypothetical protein